MSVYFYGCMSLDGYLADKNHCLDWLHQTGSTEDTGYEAFYQNMDITSMGRRTFREIENLTDAGNIYPTTTNFVFTHKEEATKPTVKLEGITADFYQSEVDISCSAIVWVDPKNDYFVSVAGFFSREELIEMALSMVKTEVAKPK